MFTRTAFFAALIVATSFANSAEARFPSAAVATPSQVAGIDASTATPGPAKSPKRHAGHANADHPAIAMRRAGAASPIDPNTFIVQPPAHVEWTEAPTVAR